MNIPRILLNSAFVSSTLIGTSLVGLSGSAMAGTLVTCGPNGAASIVKVVPAGCRHLSATSAPKHAPENEVKESRLGFTFTASSPNQETTKTVANQSQDQSIRTQPVALR